MSASVGHPPPHHLDVVSWWDEVKILLGRLLPLRFNLDLPVLPGSPTRDRLEKNDRTTSDFTTKIRSFFSGKKVGGLKFEMQPNYWGMKWLLFFLLLLLLLRNSVVLFDRKKILAWKVGMYCKLPRSFCAMNLPLPCVFPSQKVDSLITGTGLQYAEAGVEAQGLRPVETTLSKHQQ